MNPKRAPRVASMLLWMFSAALCQAQTTPPKPAAQPARPAAAGADVKTLGGSANAAAKLLTRDELRACLKQREELAQTLGRLDGERGALDGERAGLRAEQDKLRDERDDLGGVKAPAAELNVKVKSFQEQVDTFNKRVATFKDANTSGREADREREDINREAEALQKRQLELQKDRDALLARGEDAVKAFNARSALVDQKIADWNVRNSKVNDASEGLKRQRETWVAECGDRRYREDDEKAILGGK